MDPAYVQHLRYKLQKRVSRLNATDSHDGFVHTLAQFWRFFDQYSTFLGIIDLLLTCFPDAESEAERIFQGNRLYPESEDEAAAIAYFILRKLVDDSKTHEASRIGGTYGRIGRGGGSALDVIREFFLEPFYEYVDERLDDQRAMLGLLLRYKHRSEWFNRDRLWPLAQESSIAEHNLALNLYAYLYDQGIDFNIETESIRGRIDLIAAQHSADPLLLDVKIFDGESRNRHYIRKAFRQIYTYTQHFNEPFGYLVIFDIAPSELRFSLERSLSNVPVVVHNHKTIFLLTIDVRLYEQPVSQRPPLTVVEITEGDFIRILDESEEEETTNKGLTRLKDQD